MCKRPNNSVLLGKNAKGEKKNFSLELFASVMETHLRQEEGISLTHTHTPNDLHTHTATKQFFQRFICCHIVATGDVTAALTCAEETVVLLYLVGKQWIQIPVTNRAG